MELTLPSSLTTAEFLVALLRATGLGVVLLASAGLLRSFASRRGASPAGAILRGGAGCLLVAAAMWLGIIGFSLVYPHHHHDMQWVETPSLNYWIDAALGASVWAVAWLLYRITWKLPNTR